MGALAWIGVGLLGGAGALARFLLDGLIAGRLGRELPYGTFAVNISGAFLLGLLTGLAVRGTALILAGTAVLGSYTTFSTWMFETQRLGEDGEVSGAVINLVGSLLAGLGAVALGRLLGAHG